MLNDRFELIEEPTGTWAVFDNTTGVPASFQCRVLIGLSKEDAEACIACLSTEAVLSPSPSSTSSTADEGPPDGKTTLVE